MNIIRILAITVVVLVFGLLFQTYMYIDSNKHFNELYAESQKTVSLANKAIDLGKMWKNKYDSVVKRMDSISTNPISLTGDVIATPVHINKAETVNIGN